MSIEIDGKAIAMECRAAVQARVAAYRRDRGYAPGLGVILVGSDHASAVYVRNKEMACRKAGIASFHHDLKADATVEQLERKIDQLNDDPKVHGILLQLSLPKHLPESDMLERIHPHKDVDGFHPISAGMLAVGRSGFVPCTPRGIMKLVESTGQPTQGKRAVVIGRSNIVGKPVAQLLLAANCTVTICHSRTVDLPDEVRRADIVVAAIGRADFVKGDWIKPGAVVIDVGINRRDNGDLCGDVDFDAARKHAGWITPVPGGVGPMTVAMLLENTLEGALRYDPPR